MGTLSTGLPAMQRAPPWLTSTLGVPSASFQQQVARCSPASRLQLQRRSSLGNSSKIQMALQQSNADHHHRWNVVSTNNGDASLSVPSEISLQLESKLDENELNSHAGTMHMKVEVDCSLWRDADEGYNLEGTLLSRVENDSKWRLLELQHIQPQSTSKDNESLEGKNGRSSHKRNSDKVGSELISDDLDEATDFDNVVGSSLKVKKMMPRLERSKGKKNSQQMWYLFGAIASTTAILNLAVGAILYRFAWRTPASGLEELPYAEMVATFLLTGGAAVGMEYWARWAHEALWHASWWHMHESHHRPRDGPFEKNDVLAIVNAAPAIALMLYGVLNEGLTAGLCFGTGLGMTIYGMAYMFVHDGLVHRRFSVGPVAEVPYLKRVAAAHHLHHSNAFGGVPYGLFLGEKEIEKAGGNDQLEHFLKNRERRKTTSRRKGPSRNDG